MVEAPRILLEHHLKRLKLPTFLREYEKLARQCAAEGLDHVQFLARLVELELIDRERRLVERLIKQAGFPVVKQLESFDFKAIPALNKMLVLDLARGEYIARRENVILLGPSGVGKTHVALALAACQKGLGVRFATASHLVHELIEARDEKRLLRLQAQLARVNLGEAPKPISTTFETQPSPKGKGTALEKVSTVKELSLTSAIAPKNPPTAEPPVIVVGLNGLTSPKEMFVPLPRLRLPCSLASGASD